MSTTNEPEPDTDTVGDPEFASWFQMFQEAFLWFTNQPELCERHGGRAVVLHKRQVIGEGPTPFDAEEDARRRAADRGSKLPPAKERCAFLVPPMLWVDETLTFVVEKPAPAQESA